MKDLKKNQEINPRVYRGEQEVDHDLFKLLIASTRKNMSYSRKQPIWESVEHTHFFHTYDSSGKKMNYSSAVGGHFHPVEWKIENGKLVAFCGKPLSKNDGMGKTIPYENDSHTHDIQYIRSERVQVRKINEKGAMIISEAIASEPSTVAGLTSASR